MLPVLFHLQACAPLQAGLCFLAFGLPAFMGTIVFAYLLAMTFKHFKARHCF